MTKPRPSGLRAFAKVNLSLDVGARRADGYHDIASVMQTISLFDVVEARPSRDSGPSLVCEGADVPTGPDNLVWRAARAVLDHTASTSGLEMGLRKTIPAMAGLGGGSSDAAAALRASFAALALAPSNTDLLGLAASLGSDVPFFVRGGTQLVGGRGEKLTPLPDAPRLWFVIVKPATGVSTAEAYRSLDALPGARRTHATEEVLAALARSDIGALFEAMGNDFEHVVPPMCPAVQSAMDALRQAGAAATHLCGSGSAVFGALRTQSEAEAVLSRLHASCGQTFLCRSIGADEVDET